MRIYFNQMQSTINNDQQSTPKIFIFNEEERRRMKMKKKMEWTDQYTYVKRYHTQPSHILIIDFLSSFLLCI